MNSLKEYYLETFGSAQGMPAYEEWTTSVYLEMANSAGYAAWLQARAITAVGEKICEALQPRTASDDDAIYDAFTGETWGEYRKRSPRDPKKQFWSQSDPHTLKQWMNENPNTVFFQKEGIEKIFEAEIDESGKIVPGKLVLDFSQDPEIKKDPDLMNLEMELFDPTAPYQPINYGTLKPT